MKKIIIKFIILTFIIVTLTLIYSRYIETKRLVTKEITITENNINKDFDGIKIVHISDIHYKRIINKDFLDKITKEINLINPDIIIFTGDLIDRNSTLKETDIDILKEFLKNLNAKYGKYSVIGNHDYIINIEQLRNIYTSSGFMLLENNYDLIYSKNNNTIYIGGISTGNFNEEDINNMIIEDDIYKILIFHEPDFVNEFQNINADLLLSGHSHNGQVNIPLLKKYFLPKNATKYYKEYYNINGKDLFISSGIGVSRYNFRLFNPPKINFYRINKETN